MDFNQIQELIRMVSKHKLSEFSLKQGDFKLTIRNQGAAAIEGGVAPIVVTSPQPLIALPSTSAPMAAAATPAPQAKAEAAAALAASEDAKLLAIKSPMVGTFYRSGGPDKPPFVKIGDTVDIGSKVCIIEAMKLFNEIDSEVKGKIVKILVEDASPVEYDQPLFMVEAL
ncbi:MAG: acetyl-CoA carboxylase biotin carboxyl carrier protein [Phycisphaerae bacterium]|nr:acetyl-CoA carboxylase biotin carboxyl carrier protein [Saprospiraceae bacterium]